ncbi:MAG TPA: PEGA domain-containing protein [Blastocatellia bacterium]|nr:PEGA domain-containing protein [Blastocatellia bacterium]
MIGRTFLTIALLSLLAVIALAQEKPATPPANAVQADSLVLPDGTPVRLKLGRDLSSATEKTDARVDFEVVEDVKVRDLVVIPRGSLALGRVTLAQPKRRMGRTGKLEVDVETVKLASGDKAPIRATQTAPDGSRVGTVTAVTVATGIVFFPAAPLFLLMKGKDIFIPKGTLVTAYVNGDQRLDETKFRAPESNATKSSEGKP